MLPLSKADCFDVSIDYLLCRTDNPKINKRSTRCHKWVCFNLADLPNALCVEHTLYIDNCQEVEHKI